MKGIDDSLQWWHQPTIKDKFVAEEDERNMHKQHDQILNMKLKRQRQKAKHGAFSINARMKKMTRLEQYIVWKKKKKKTQPFLNFFFVKIHWVNPFFDFQI